MDTESIRKQFPILSKKINGRKLAYFDNAATTQKPVSVLAAMNDYYTESNANAHRGIHTLAQEATGIVENSRKKIAKFLNASSPDEIVFTSGATEGLNLLATGLCAGLESGDEIILSELEHHSNIVPWQIAAREKRLKIKYIPATEQGRLDLTAYRRLLNKKTKILSVTGASNVTGAITPLKKIISLARQKGALTVVDAAQAAAHIRLDVRKMDCDFLVFSGHKLFGPTGVGALFGKLELLKRLPPFKFGGHMIEEVTKNFSRFAGVPEKFEAGTPPIAEIAGLAAALDFVNRIGSDKIERYEKRLTAYALKRLAENPKISILGPKTPKDRIPVISFVMDGIPAHDLASILDGLGIATRSGHHCAQILHREFGIPASIRASLCFYNTEKEIDELARGLKIAEKIFQ